MTKPEDISEEAWAEATAIPLPFGHERIARAIDAATMRERERCAKIAESYYRNIVTPAHFVPGDDDESLGYVAGETRRTSGNLPLTIAAAIRGQS